MLGCALIEGGGVLLAWATERVAVPPVHAAGRGVHVVAVGRPKVAAPVLKNTQSVLQVREADAGSEEVCLGCYIPAGPAGQMTSNVQLRGMVCFEGEEEVCSMAYARCTSMQHQ